MILLRAARAAWVAGLLLTTAAYPASGEPAVSSPPYEMMRALSILQDQVAVGNAIAQIGQIKMIERMAERFATIDPSVWKDKRNARALILYLFAGGNAAAIDGIIDKDDIAKGYEALFAGATAYASGDDVKGRAAVLPMDPGNLPTGLGGHLALVQATLVANQDKPRALQLLDLARLLEPGTLVEEAALRKEMFLIGAEGDLDKFALLARRYEHGFAKSVYAENFRQLRVKTAFEIAKADNAEGGKRLDQFLSSVEPRERQVIYLAVAKAAVAEGRLTVGSLAGAAGARLSDKPDAAQARGNVYFGAASVIGSEYDRGIKVLNSVDPARLSSADAALRASALEVASMIRASTLEASETEAGGSHESVQQTVVDAEKSLKTSEALLQRTKP